MFWIKEDKYFNQKSKIIPSTSVATNERDFLKKKWDGDIYSP